MTSAYFCKMITGAFTFKKFTGEKLDNIEEYVKEYCKTHPNIDILVGTDSQNRGQKTVFSTIIAMYDKGDGTHGHGAHCVFSRWNTPRYRREQSSERLLKEVEESINTANKLKNVGVKVKYIDLDINPNPGTGNHRNVSNDIYSTAKGWVEGSGYECRWKTLGPLVTTMADWVVKG